MTRKYKEKTKYEFINSDVYLWIKSIMNEDGLKNFGWFTLKFHNCILDKPMPYRS